MGCMGFIVMRSFHRLSNKDSCQVRKDEGLDKCNQYFDHVNKNGKGNGYR